MKTSDNQQISEHAMRAANILYDATATQWAPESVAPTIDQYAIVPAVAEVTIKHESAVIDLRCQLAERDKRIAELEEALRHALKIVDGLEGQQAMHDDSHVPRRIHCEQVLTKQAGIVVFGT